METDSASHKLLGAANRLGFPSVSVGVLVTGMCPDTNPRQDSAIAKKLVPVANPLPRPLKLGEVAVLNRLAGNEMAGDNHPIRYDTGTGVTKPVDDIFPHGDDIKHLLAKFDPRWAGNSPMIVFRHVDLSGGYTPVELKAKEVSQGRNNTNTMPEQWTTRTKVTTVPAGCMKDGSRTSATHGT
jgi:hypothetical protein